MKGPLIFFDIESRGRDKTWPFPQAAVKKWIKKKKKKKRREEAEGHTALPGSSLSPPRGSCLHDFSKAVTV